MNVAQHVVTIGPVLNVDRTHRRIQIAKLVAKSPSTIDLIVIHIPRGLFKGTAECLKIIAVPEKLHLFEDPMCSRIRVGGPSQKDFGGTTTSNLPGRSKQVLLASGRTASESQELAVPPLQAMKHT